MRSYCLKRTWKLLVQLFTASVMHIDVLPEYRMGGYGLRLFKAFEQWAKNRNVVEIQFGVNSGDDLDTVDEFAIRLAYQKMGEKYVKQN